jgi:hypothetical protein
MLFIDRPDGVRLRQKHPLNALMPYMMRGRNESAVYYQKELDVENVLRLVRTKNAAMKARESGEEQDRYSLFSVAMAAVVRTLAIRPELNRFIHGRALYQRKDIVISFIVKQRMAEEAPEGSARIRFAPEDDLEAVTQKVNNAIAHIREVGEGGEGERIARVAHSIPGAKALVMGLYRLFDRFNLAPKALLEADPLFATCYFANLGSIGLDTPFHHLYEWGNASFFVVMGKLMQKESHRGAAGARRHFIDFKVTLDERISDGLYFARSASVFYRLLDKPELLEMPLGEAKAILQSGAQ